MVTRSDMIQVSAAVVLAVLLALIAQVLWG